ncbi:MYB-like protein [Pochonia chlamydosporia 170]|uniref:MYB-like protein n=1 Tax=Pochonia chlamydosporia 170 TaxID=1380566 RepID=A0A179FFH6_METCM|nr:MYB-like protein [Pochonia chlamydosporia 170]OAQ64272.1 MYB-like protein [Pochonia chlamydosporia 170]
MLLPSALSCDSAQPSRPSLQSSFFSPPASPPTMSSATALSNIMTTCRSLQSLIATPVSSSLSVPPPSLGQLPTPPLAHAALPMKLRLRARPARSDASNTEDLYTRRRIVKRSVPPRGVNKRRRPDADDMGREDQDLSSEEEDIESDLDLRANSPEPAAPSTPKRARIAPEQLPLGLERSDFHDIHTQGADVAAAADSQEWTAEDDRILVELVLEKLKLSKSEWQDCARNLGKDRHTVNKRWKSLIMKGEVGLKTRSSNRRRLHSTWR